MGEEFGNLQKSGCIHIPRDGYEDEEGEEKNQGARGSLMLKLKPEQCGHDFYYTFLRTKCNHDASGMQKLCMRESRHE
jgi:hypothetical protein